MIQGVVDQRSGDIRWDGRKWPDQLHWQFPLIPLGEDPHGLWFAVPAGTIARRGHEPPLRLPRGFVMLVPADTWWEAEFYPPHPDHEEIYVNIGTPCDRHPGRIRQVDLDLDVIRTFDGAVETLDEDEFADHQVRFAYPQELIDGARRTAEEVAGMLVRREEPFDRAASDWMSTAESSGLL